MNRHAIPKIVVTPPTEDIDLDQLIEDRKQEKRKVLKEKLQQKMKIIRDRRIHGVKNEPFPEGAFEQLRRNNMLWEVVLEYLTDPSNVTSAYIACGTFVKILEKRRMLMLLPKVLEIFKDKVDFAYKYKNEAIRKSYHQNWHRICMSPHGVCKRWKKTVDFHSNIAKDDWHVTGFDGYSSNDDPRRGRFIFEDEQSVDKATSFLCSRGMTRSPIRDVMVVFCDRSPEPYYRKLMDYLRIYGSSVRTVQFNYDGNPRTIAAAAREKLYDVTELMQNLKSLRIQFDDDNDDELRQFGKPLQPQHRQQRFIHFSSSPLRSLEHLSFCGWNGKESLVAEILRECVNLRSMTLDDNEPADNETVEALMGLSLERFEGLYTVPTSHRFIWPLKHLEIRTNSEEAIEIDASHLFPAINQFWNTLEHLLNHDYVCMDDDTDTNLCLDLPHLKSFMIFEITVGTISLDNLLPLKSMEELCVDFIYHEVENTKVKIQSYMDSRDMDKSNVWQCFPHLKYLQIDCKVFKRP